MSQPPVALITESQIAAALSPAGERLVCDVVHQCERVGELHHAPAAGVVPRAEIGEVLTGRKPGRENDDEIVVFDSTGTAVQDTAAAVAVHLRTQGTPFNLWA